MTMFGKYLLPVLAAGTAAAMTPALAHHSFAMFDQTKLLQLAGATVTRFEWTNPHSFVIVKSGSTLYTLECSSPNLMSHQGWKYNSIKPGDQISIAYYPLRDGQPVGKTMSAW